MLPLLAALAGGCAYDVARVGERLSAADRRVVAEVTAQALEKNKVGESANWSNAESGRRGAVTPTRTFERDGTPCRDFQQTATVDGRTAFARDSACRTAEGGWKSRNYADLAGAIAAAAVPGGGDRAYRSDYYSRGYPYYYGYGHGYGYPYYRHGYPYYGYGYPYYGHRRHFGRFYH